MACLTSVPAAAQTVERPLPEKVGVFGGVGYLGSPGLDGMAFALGVRYLPLPALALTFDAGYGVLGGSADVQDRWWLMPSIAAVIPAGRRVHIDVGAGLGFAASSGYASWQDYTAAPFGPAWAYQLVPALRGHAMAILKLTRTMDVFVRLDVGSLLLGGNSIGSRVDDPKPSSSDTLWYDILAGVHFRLL